MGNDVFTNRGPLQHSSDAAAFERKAVEVITAFAYRTRGDAFQKLAGLIRARPKLRTQLPDELKAELGRRGL